MTNKKFRLDDVRNESIRTSSKVVREYSVKNKSQDYSDKTFCITQLFCGCNKLCSCDREYRCNPQVLGGEACGCDNEDHDHRIGCVPNI